MQTSMKKLTTSTTSSEMQELISKFRGREAALVDAKLKNDPRAAEVFERKENREIGILAAKVQSWKY